ncbi:MAG: DUF4115 domain-containing protein [Melioribacteraceae bacterium]|nr:DUF4115 domain-containing protein [Melioribacteraceae bacterium]MCF8353469.1 DUF4115 domain-containing protein [Melioribacteraceae bacterium]MCF8392598.1 DUF4115 domain-containing protein [Melioribacteraceae bacterium]MCF8418530.1 DUF4115 domain-containing protein [Melioribacteraceae bacterium]
MGTEVLREFAAELKKAREDKNLKLQDIFNKTRIDIKYLEAIENGNFEIMPEVYIRAFIKGYAKTVDINPENALKKYDMARQGKVTREVIPGGDEKSSNDSKSKNVKEFISPNEDDVQTAKPSWQKNKNVIMLAGIGLILIVTVVLYFTLIAGSTTSIITERPYEEVIEEHNQRFEPVAEDQDKIAQPKTSTNKPFELLLTGTDTVWLRAMIDDKAAEEFTVLPNGKLTLNIKSEANLLIGNAGGLKLFLNNKELNSLGKKGEVKNIKVDINGVTQLKIPNENR